MKDIRLLIRQGKIQRLIVYHRDRLARNFYEYITIVKELYKYKVEVIFLAHNHPPFSQDLFFESILGIFAQDNGQTIKNRQHDLTKHYPMTPYLGYKRVGTKNKTRYYLDPKRKDDFYRFFLDASNIEKPECVYKLLVNHKKLFKGKSYEDILSYLSNPFYCAHFETNGGFEKLNHIEPLISLEIFQKIQLNLGTIKCQVLNTIQISETRSSIIPICSQCKTEMKFRTGKITESGYYVCANKHKTIRISVEEFNEQLEHHIGKVIESIDYKGIKSDCNSFLNKMTTELNQKVNNLSRLLYFIHEDISLTAPTNNKKLLKQLEKETKVKLEIKNVEILLLKIDDALNGINNLTNTIKDSLTSELKNYETKYLFNKFIEKVEVDNDKIIYFIPFGKYFGR